MTSSKRSVSIVAAAVVLVVAGAALYYLFSVVPEHKARRRAFEDYLSRARELRDLRKDSSGAAAVLEKALAIDPESREASLLMGQIEIDLNRFDRAIKRLEPLVNLGTAGSGDTIQAELLIGRAYLARFRDTLQRRDFDRSRSRLARVLRSSREREVQAEAAASLFWLYLWMARLDPKQRERAREYCEKYETLSPDSPTAEMLRNAYATFSQEGG